jgi:hypothetical protein
MLTATSIPDAVLAQAATTMVSERGGNPIHSRSIGIYELAGRKAKPQYDIAEPENAAHRVRDLEFRLDELSKLVGELLLKNQELRNRLANGTPEAEREVAARG